ncbi:thiamine phosphate synthase [Sediminibacillus albus]|uniref:Thiamine-phosphate synthase n=1 Tax=Sediminibacillus albus TaxID=407036 RepID=A0A1G9APG3_9BACI|nr:thiamine phosphate synthase [Sediminibacillus albus]SDK29259.1 thiamine-phosphate pyrophosphorylase [Sediminibacillus albus]
MLVRESLQVYFIMGSNNCRGEPLQVVEQALKGGITMFQFREKGSGAKTGKEKHSLAIKLKQLCNHYGVPFIVNDDVDLAVDIGADGVHVGQDDEPLASVKQRCPKSFIIGVSATNSTEAVQAFQAGADYIGAGPVFPTSTKQDAKLPIGLAGLEEINRLTGETPVTAIGGIHTDNAADAIKAGADGVSVISAISQAESPQQAAQLLNKLTAKKR